MCSMCERPDRRPGRKLCPADCEKAIPSCFNCSRYAENLLECILVREEGGDVCEFWPENNLAPKGAF